MKISKLRIRNMFGVTEFDSDGKDLELTGKRGAGKTSVIDAIRYALTNNPAASTSLHRDRRKARSSLRQTPAFVSTGRFALRRLIISLSARVMRRTRRQRASCATSSRSYSLTRLSSRQWMRRNRTGSFLT